MGVVFGGGNIDIESVNANFAQGWSEYTMVAWVLSDVTSTNHGYFNLAQPDGRDRFGCVRYDSSGASGGGNNVFKFGLEINNTEFVTESRENVQTTDVTFLVGRWQSGSPTDLWLNDGSAGSTFTDGPAPGTITGTGNLTFGKGPQDEGSAAFPGTVFEHRVYNAYLSDQELLAIYNTPGSDNIIRGLEIWFQLIDSAENTSPNTIIDSGPAAQNMTVSSGSPLISNLQNIKIRRR